MARATERFSDVHKESIGKVCARFGCSNTFDDDLLFMTCPACRIRSVDAGGGCRYWEGAARDPRVTKQKDMTCGL